MSSLLQFLVQSVKKASLLVILLSNTFYVHLNLLLTTNSSVSMEHQTTDLKKKRKKKEEAGNGFALFCNTILGLELSQMLTTQSHKELQFQDQLQITTGLKEYRVVKVQIAFILSKMHSTTELVATLICLSFLVFKIIFLFG